MIISRQQEAIQMVEQAVKVAFGAGVTLREIEQMAATISVAPANAGELVLRDDKRAFWKGQLLPLTASEFRMVELLASQPGYSRTYRALYDMVHGKAGMQMGRGAEGFRVNVRTFIKRIREKFEAIDPEFKRIQNYAYIGYVWKK